VPRDPTSQRFRPEEQALSILRIHRFGGQCGAWRKARRQQQGEHVDSHGRVTVFSTVVLAKVPVAAGTQFTPSVLAQKRQLAIIPFRLPSGQNLEARDRLRLAHVHRVGVGLRRAAEQPLRVPDRTGAAVEG
jgi:hypothetical protein